MGNKDHGKYFENLSSKYKILSKYIKDAGAIGLI